MTNKKMTNLVLLLALDANGTRKFINLVSANFLNCLLLCMRISMYMAISTGIPKSQYKYSGCSNLKM